MPDYKVIDADVLVVGGGMAGLWAAIRARDFGGKVILVEKGKVSRSGISVFCHGYLAPLSPEMHEPAIKDIVERSSFIADQEWIKILVEENNDRVAEMEGWGAIFRKDEKKTHEADRWVRGWKVRAWALAEGKQVMEVLRARALKQGVVLAERVMVADLLTSDGKHPTAGRVVGAVGLNTRTGEPVVYRAKSVILTTGGASGKLHYGYADNVTGDGQAMAFRAGAALGGMELSPSNYFGLWNRRFCTGGQGQFQIGGARLVNRLGEEFLKKYPACAKEFVGFRDQTDYGDLCRAMAVEILEGRGPLYFDMRAWSGEQIDKMRQVLPFTMMAFDKAGIDLNKELVETTPVVGLYCMSTQAGMTIDLHSETTIHGLYAAGAASMVARSAMPQSLCIVCGYRAGEDAGRKGSDRGFGPVDSRQVEELTKTMLAPRFRHSGKSPDEIYYAVNRTVTSYGVNLFGEDKRLRAALDKVRQISAGDLPRVNADDAHELVKANEARSFVQLMELVLESALVRKESRLAHYRADYPFRDDREWLKNVICRRKEDGHLAVTTEPVDLKYVAPATRSVIPSPVNYALPAREGL